MTGTVTAVFKFYGSSVLSSEGTHCHCLSLVYLDYFAPLPFSLAVPMRQRPAPAAQLSSPSLSQGFIPSSLRNRTPPSPRVQSAPASARDGIAAGFKARETGLGERMRERRVGTVGGSGSRNFSVAGRETENKIWKQLMGSYDRLLGICQELYANPIFFGGEKRWRWKCVLDFFFFLIKEQSKVF